VNKLWTNCSRNDLRNYYLKEKVKGWCMEEKPDACCYKADLNSENFEHLGCFTEDPENLSVPILLGKKTSPDGAFTAQECYEMAESYPIFGIRDYECWAAPNKQTYASKGKSTKCNCDRGALNSISVFGVVGKGPFNVEDLGCWADKLSWHRAFGTLLKHDAQGMMKEQCFEIVKEENVKRSANGKNPYVVFAVQDLRECWASEKREEYKKYGKSNQCLGKGPIWGGRGGAWAGNVYRFKTSVPPKYWIDN